MIDRLLKIIELKNINKSQFYKMTGLSNGFLDKVKDIGSSKIEDILKTFPDINAEWLVTGQGEMLKEEADMQLEEPAGVYIGTRELTKENEALREEIKQLKAHNETLKDYNAMLKHQLGLEDFSKGA